MKSVNLFETFVWGLILFSSILIISSRFFFDSSIGISFPFENVDIILFERLSNLSFIRMSLTKPALYFNFRNSFSKSIKFVEIWPYFYFYFLIRFPNSLNDPENSAFSFSNSNSFSKFTLKTSGSLDKNFLWF